MIKSKNLKRSLLLFALLLLLALFAFLLIFDYQGPVAEATPYNKAAGTGDNVSGFAWSDFYGWIKLNDDSDGGQAYGVHVDEVSLELRGHAWSSNLGWISFEEVLPISHTSFRSNCLPGTCANCSACFNYHGSYPFGSGGDFHGWAKVLDMGDNGWISLRGTADDGSSYGISVPNIDLRTITGYVWLSGISQEWISFEEDYFSSTAVINRPPLPINLTAPNWGGTQPCDDTALRAFLRWEFFDPDFGDTQKAYQLVLRNESDSTVPDFDTGICEFVGGNCFVAGNAEQFPLTHAQLNYGDVYSWTLQVWDNNDSYSPIVAFDLDISGHDRIGGETDLVSSTTFQVYYAEFPDPDNFIWYPNPFSHDEEVYLSSEDRAIYFIGNTAYNCDVSRCEWLWTSPNANLTLRDNPSNASTSVMQVRAPGHTLNLTVQDYTWDHPDYQCSTSTSFSPKRKLPGWVETN